MAMPVSLVARYFVNERTKPRGSPDGICRFHRKIKETLSAARNPLDFRRRMWYPVYRCKVCRVITATGFRKRPGSWRVFPWMKDGLFRRARTKQKTFCRGSRLAGVQVRRAFCARAGSAVRRGTVFLYCDAVQTKNNRCSGPGSGQNTKYNTEDRKCR